MEAIVIHRHFVFVLVLFACGAAIASESQVLANGATPSEKDGGSARVIPVPDESLWEHKTYSPDKKLFAIFAQDGWDEVISIHDAASGKQIRSIVGHGDFVEEFKFSDDGKVLASRCSNRDRRGWAVWDVAAGKLLMHLPDDVPPSTKVD